MKRIAKRLATENVAFSATALVDEKHCRHCGETKSVSEFYQSIRMENGTPRLYLSSWCKRCTNANSRERDARDPWSEARKRERERALRRKVLAAYGHMCGCCGEERAEFLALHHVNHDGAEQRRLLGQGNHVSWWAVRNDFPDTLELLCHNCNEALGLYRHCPHGGRTKWEPLETILKPPSTASVRRQSLRRRILEHYGHRCACCGENRYEFLVIDHIFEDGAAHRREIGSGQRTYQWLKANEYPEGFRVLCQNCNKALGAYGYCPHMEDGISRLSPVEQQLRLTFKREYRLILPDMLSGLREELLAYL
jgi:hypothetical protein